MTCMRVKVERVKMLKSPAILEKEYDAKTAIDDKFNVQRYLKLAYTRIEINTKSYESAMRCDLM